MNTNASDKILALLRKLGQNDTDTALSVIEGWRDTIVRLAVFGYDDNEQKLLDYLQYLVEDES